MADIKLCVSPVSLLLATIVLQLCLIYSNNDGREQVKV